MQTVRWDSRCAKENTWDGGTLLASTRVDNHSFVLFHYCISVVIEVEHHDGRQVSWCATRLGNVEWVHDVHQVLDGRVIGCIGGRCHRERTCSVTVESMIAFRGNYPFLVSEWKQSKMSRWVKGPELHTCQFKVLKLMCNAKRLHILLKVPSWKQKSYICSTAFQFNSPKKRFELSSW